MSLSDKIQNNKLVQLAYRAKWNFDLGVGQISWVSGKLPELMSVVYLAEKFGYALTSGDVVTLCVIGGLSILCFGMIWKRAGMYDTERRVATTKDPIMNEIYLAAKKINGGKNGRISK